MKKESIKDQNQDLPDSPRDKEQLKPENTVIDMPDVKDIPGQEHIHVPKLKGFNDVTIASDDEEGAGIWDEEEDET